jgi:hypothetical protein
MEKEYLKFLAFYSSCYVDRIYKLHSNITDAYKADAPSLDQIRLVNKDSCLEHFLRMWMNYVSERIKVKTNPDEIDKNLVIVAICKEFQHFKISEVAYIFIEMATGKYGIFYQSFTPVYILQCFREYDLMRKKFLPYHIKIDDYTTNTRAAFIVNGLLESGHLKV